MNRVAAGILPAVEAGRPARRTRRDGNSWRLACTPVPSPTAGETPDATVHGPHARPKLEVRAAHQPAEQTSWSDGTWPPLSTLHLKDSSSILRS